MTKLWIVLGFWFGFLAGLFLALYLERHVCCPGEVYVDRNRIERPTVTCPESGWAP